MVTVNSCCCFSVETGGLILGWIGIIGNAIGGLFLLAMLAGYNALTCEDILQNEQFQEAFPDWTMENCQFLKTIILVGIIVGIVSNLIAFIIYVMLVRGIKTRNPGKIIPAVVINGIGVTIIILGNLFTFSLKGLFSAVIGGAIGIYFFLVLYTVYVNIKSEKRRSYSAQYAHA
ncbi:unnamed protein product [Chironomus riparius]|uniref:Uncharacterized protein n=1 Tax=Chironomus riparius TaxID=315576 RepID=A0A9N9WQ96_9DIPT|nr:unnamed protein product [Chironomus riparius]